MDDMAYQNTYEMEPREGYKFHSSAVQSIIQETLEARLGNKVYDPDESPRWSKELCAEIEERVRELNFPRYKIVVQTVIGEVKDQGARVASRCLWNTSTDAWASDYYQNSSLFAVAMVFGLYYE